MRNKYVMRIDDPKCEMNRIFMSTDFIMYCCVPREKIVVEIINDNFVSMYSEQIIASINDLLERNPNMAWNKYAIKYREMIEEMTESW